MSKELPENVIKKDGSKEDFSAEKIEKSIQLAVQQTKGLSSSLRMGMTEYCLDYTQNMLRGREDVRTASIRDIIITGFKKPGPSIAETWRIHEQSKANET